MPVIGIPVERLNSLLNKKISTNELEELLKCIGCDVEGLTTLRRFKCQKCETISEITAREEKPSTCSECTLDFTKNPQLINEIEPIEVIRMELLPVRPDNFDPGGLARSLRGYLGIDLGLASYTLKDSIINIKIDANLKLATSYRPYISCAVIKGINLDQDLLKIIMKMQENLHWGLGRDRKNASIGVYDLDTISPPIEYKAVSPDDLKFTPLGYNKEMYLCDILNDHPKGRNYKHLLENFNAYPILEDKNGQVLSMPPIINSEETRVTVKTKNLFIDVTGINELATIRSLNIITTSILELSKEAQCYRVNLNYPDSCKITPDFVTSTIEVFPEKISKLVGIDITEDDLVRLLERMRFGTSKNNGKLIIKIPSYRNDIMHQYDIVEDVAISYGYKNIKRKLIGSMTIGKEKDERSYINSVQSIMTGLGFIEVVTLMLTSPLELERIHYTQEDREYIEIENPINLNNTILRPTLLKGLLETLTHNKHNELPQKIFEIGEIFNFCKETETRSREDINLACAIIDSTIGFSNIQSYLFSVARELCMDIELEANDYPMMINGRAAKIYQKAGGNKKAIGIIGEVHPEILLDLGLFNPCAIFEMKLIENNF